MIQHFLGLALMAMLSANAAAQSAAEPAVRYNPVPRPTFQCDLPAAPADAQLVAFSAYEGDAISSAVVGNQDVETSFIEVTIEPGSAPLYVVLVSHESMIWKITGATSRVAQVVVSSSHGDRNAWRTPAGGRIAPLRQPPVLVPSFSGTIGVPKSKVDFAHIDCPGYFSDLADQKARAAFAYIERELGRAPDAMFAAYSTARVALPSGAQYRADEAPTPRGFDPETWEEATRFWPGGLVRVDPESVAAAVPVEDYQVLPSQMGISQLVGSGAIRPEGGRAFRVVRPIAHMPPSMGGAHSVTLTFAKGVPVPPGSPVHSCIIDEDSGARTGATCGR